MSTEHQKYSVENQAEAIAGYAKQHGMIVVRTYSDAGRSGLNIKGRPGLQSLLAAVQGPAPDFMAVLVYDISRWGRFPDPDEAAVYEHTCKSRGIRVIYCAEPVKNDGSLPSTVFIGIKRSMAAEYSRELSVKVFNGACTIVKHGFRQGGSPGYGLRRQLVDEHGTPKGILMPGQQKSIQTDRVVLVPGPEEEVLTVSRIYQMFLDKGYPERVIASVLNREGVLGENGRQWTRGSVHSVLTSEKYIGNNVYNKVSNKLKVKYVRNPATDWVRRDGAFQAIVATEDFRRVQEIVAARAVHLSQEEMVSRLKAILDKHSRLSAILIDEEDDAPSSNVYRARFHGLLRAYSFVGYQPKRDYKYLEINRALRSRHADLVDQTLSKIQAAGGWGRFDGDTDLLHINDELRVSVVLAPCKVTPGGSYRWRVRLDSSLEPDVSVAVRMDRDNKGALDYYVFPSIDFTEDQVPSRMDNGISLDLYRTDSLDHFCRIAGRLNLKEAA